MNMDNTVQGSLFPAYGPSWHRDRSKSELSHKNSSDFPLPDGVNTGPVIEVTVVPGSEKKIAPLTMPRIRQMKAVERKFPINGALPCILPIQGSSSSYSSIRDLRTLDLYGNTVASFDIGESQYLIYVTSGTSKQVQVSQIKQDKNVIANCKYMYTVQDKRLISQKNYVYQIDAKAVSDVGYMLVRSRKKVSLYSMNQELNINKVNKYSLSGAKCACIHPTLNAHLAVANSDSTVHVYNTERKSPLWISTFESEHSTPSVFECEFGNHPLYLYVASDHDTWLADLRATANVSRKLFTLKNMRTYIDRNETICALKGVPNLPYIYMICCDSVVLLDNRFCKSPVISWKHMIPNKPAFPQFYSDVYSSTKGLILTDRWKNNVCIIPSRYSSNEVGDAVRTQAVSVPKHFNILKDTLSFANKNGLWHTEQARQSFIEQPVIGMTLTSDCVNKHAVMYFQNNKGVLFYYSLINSTATAHPTKFSKEILCALKNYEKQRLLEHRQILNLTTEKGDSFDRFHKTYSAAKDLHSSTKYEGPIWLSKITFNKKINKFTNFEDDPLAANKILTSKTKSLCDFVHQKYHSTIKIENLKKHSDPLSKQILHSWISLSGMPNTDQQYGFCFKTLPFGLNDEISVPNVQSSWQPNEITEDYEHHGSKSLSPKIISDIDVSNMKNGVSSDDILNGDKRPLTDIDSSVNSKCKKIKRKSKCQGF